MVDTASRLHGIETDTWVSATWGKFVALSHRPDFEKARCYYDKGWMQFEMAALGLWHGRENAVVLKVIGLFAGLKNIRSVELINPSFRKTGEREAQPLRQTSQIQRDCCNGPQSVAALEPSGLRS